MISRFNPFCHDDSGHPLDDCVAWWRAQQNNLLAYSRLQSMGELEAEDLLAESIKQIIRAVADKRLNPTPGNLTPYAFTVIRNTAITWKKKHASRKNVEQAYLQETVQYEQPFLPPQDSDHLREELKKRLLLLPVELAEIIVMKIWSGLSFAEIATITHCPKSTVDSRYRDALARLRKMLRDNPIDE